MVLSDCFSVLAATWRRGGSSMCLRRVLAGRAGALRARRGAAQASPVAASWGAAPTSPLMCLRRVLAGRAGALRARRGAAQASPVYEDARAACLPDKGRRRQREIDRERCARSLPPWQGPPEARESCLRRVLAGRAGALRARRGAAQASPVYEDARAACLPGGSWPDGRARYARDGAQPRRAPFMKMRAQPASLARAAGGKER